MKEEKDQGRKRGGQRGPNVERELLLTKFGPFVFRSLPRWFPLSSSVLFISLLRLFLLAGLAVYYVSLNVCMYI